MSLSLKKQNIVMTDGGIAGLLIRFAIPLLIGNLFQQFYNLVDAWVVGKYVSNEAFSAVGAVSPITNTFLGLFIGMSSGFEVVVAQHYGAKKFDAVSRAAHTAILVILSLGILTSVAGILSAQTLLVIMKVPAEVMPSARTYLHIYCAGLTSLVLYNAGAGVLRAVGDSVRPVIILLISTFTNIVLDLFFVLYLHMGVEGVAYATVISEAVSVFAVFAVMFNSRSCVGLNLRLMKIDWELLLKALRIGMPTALQLVVMSFSNIFAQSYVNHFGSDCMSGWTAYSKIDQLVFLPMQTVAMAVTTFVGQNLGNNNPKRAKQGVRMGFILIVLISITLITPVVIFAPYLVGIFNNIPEVVEYGTIMLRWISPFYLFNGMAQVYLGALRGAGNSRMPTILMLASLVVVRQIYMYVTANYISNTLVPVIMGFPICFFVCAISVYIYYRSCNLSKFRVVKPEST